MEKWSSDELAQRCRALEENMKRIQAEIAEAAIRSGRRPEDITLLAATKTVPVEVINYGIERGLDHIGENRVQELCDKYDALESEKTDVQFIGHLQTNKVKYLIGKVSMIQSVDSMKLAQEISRLSIRGNQTMDILIEVNIGREENKSGVLPEHLETLIKEISTLPALRVRGLMAIPPADADSVATQHYFSKMFEYFIDTKHKKLDNVSMDVLSMGMSGDYVQAILAGANMVRVGSALFGARNYNIR